MNICDGCGRPLRPGARFCSTCGLDVPAAPAADRPSRTPLIVGAAALITVIACATAVLVVQPWAAPAPTVAAQPSAPATPSPDGFTADPTAAATTQASTPADLDASVTADHDAVEQLVGYWVPQVSSKAIGSNPDGRYFTADDVEADHLAWASRFPGAVLLRSGDYSSFAASGYWVTVVAQPFGTAGQANSWCDSHSLGADDCFAKRLSHTAAPSGNTVHR